MLTIVPLHHRFTHCNTISLEIPPLSETSKAPYSPKLSDSNVLPREGAGCEHDEDELLQSSVPDLECAHKLLCKKAPKPTTLIARRE